MFNQKNILFFLIGILIFFWLGFYLSQINTQPVFSQPESVNMSLFWQAWEVIQEKYVNEEEIDNEKLIQGAIGGMINSLQDDYSIYLNPEETEMFLQDTEGYFQGVGMEIGIRDEQLQVIAPLPNTPAEKAGLKSGDKILKIDEQSTQNMRIDQAVKLIRGPEGSKVTLTIIRNDQEKDFVLKRAIIEIPSIKLEIIDNNIAYIKIYQFNKLILNEFSNIRNEILKKDIQGIILDLRNNPGGYLNVSVEIAENFLKKDKIVLIERKKTGEEILYTNKNNGKLLEYPLIVLINQGSASGSEIVAGALKDNNRAKIIGTPSFGKGSVQSLELLQDSSSIKITVAKWFTPNKEPIDLVGIKPDYIIELTNEQNKDAQLDKALELIKKIN